MSDKMKCFYKTLLSLKCLQILYIIQLILHILRMWINKADNRFYYHDDRNNKRA